MKIATPATAALLTLCPIATVPLAAADVQVRPRTIAVGKSTTVELAVDPNRLWPKPRAEILYAWWCWDIDPRPPECERHFCDSPVPDDPICSVSMKERAGKVVFDFKSRGLIDKANGACGETGFLLKARLGDGGVSEAKGKVDIDCGS